MLGKPKSAGEKLGIYIHIPFCRSKCDYCDFYSLAGRDCRDGAWQGQQRAGAACGELRSSGDWNQR